MWCSTIGTLVVVVLGGGGLCARRGVVRVAWRGADTVCVLPSQVIFRPPAASRRCLVTWRAGRARRASYDALTCAREKHTCRLVSSSFPCGRASRLVVYVGTGGSCTIITSPCRRPLKVELTGHGDAPPEGLRRGRPASSSPVLCSPSACLMRVQRRDLSLCCCPAMP